MLLSHTGWYFGDERFVSAPLRFCSGSGSALLTLSYPMHISPSVTLRNPLLDKSLKFR